MSLFSSNFSLYLCRRWMDRHPETSRWIPELRPAVGKLQERLRQSEWWETRLKKSSLNIYITKPQWRKLIVTFLIPSGEFWLGLENIHSLSRQGQYILQVELYDWAEEQQQEARYRLQLDGEEKKFALHLEQKSSSGVIMTTGESGLPFSTADSDNDLAADVNCAELHSGTTPSSTPNPQHTQTVWVD